MVQSVRLHRLKVETRKIDAQIKAAEVFARQDMADPGPSIAPYLRYDSDEDAEFLRHMRASANDDGVVILRWSSNERPASELAAEVYRDNMGTDQTADVSQQQSDLLKGIVSIEAQVQVQGPYANVRGFIKDLLNVPRVLSLTNAVWTRLSGGQTQLSFKVCRFVTGETSILSNQAAPQSQGASQ